MCEREDPPTHKKESSRDHLLMVLWWLCFGSHARQRTGWEAHKSQGRADGGNGPAKQEEGTVEPTSFETSGGASHTPSRSKVGPTHLVGWLQTAEVSQQ